MTITPDMLVNCVENKPPFEVRFFDFDSMKKAQEALSKGLSIMPFAEHPFLVGGKPNPRYEEARYAMNLIHNSKTLTLNK
jgi:hypothetical protein